MTVELNGRLSLDTLDSVIKELESKGFLICREVSTMDLGYTINYGPGHRVTRVMTNIPLTANVTGIRCLEDGLSLAGYALLGEEEHYHSKIEARQIEERDAVRCVITSWNFSQDRYKEICGVLSQYIEMGEQNENKEGTKNGNFRCTWR